ncbi:hypothetical protein HK405_002094 [Cladochytrium tenue]|nr:hypothetical protein HK405_002094 [Cladochytrium tenue]
MEILERIVVEYTPPSISVQDIPISVSSEVADPSSSRPSAPVVTSPEPRLKILDVLSRNPDAWLTASGTAGSHLSGYLDSDDEGPPVRRVTAKGKRNAIVQRPTSTDTTDMEDQTPGAAVTPSPIPFAATLGSLSMSAGAISLPRPPVVRLSIVVADDAQSTDSSPRPSFSSLPRAPRPASRSGDRQPGPSGRFGPPVGVMQQQQQDPAAAATAASPFGAGTDRFYSRDGLDGLAPVRKRSFFATIRDRLQSGTGSLRRRPGVRREDLADTETNEGAADSKEFATFSRNL